MITDDKKSILERVNFFVFFSFDLTHKAITRETVIRDFEIGTFFQNFRIGPIFQFNLNIWEGEENAGAIQSVPADRGIIISKIILKT